MVTALGYAVLSSDTEKFLDSCPAIRLWRMTDPCHAVFAYDEQIKMPVAPRGVWLDGTAEVQLIRLEDGDLVDLASVDYAGWVNLREAKPFKVRVKPGSDPQWWGTRLDVVERAHVLASLKKVARPVPAGAVQQHSG